MFRRNDPFRTARGLTVYNSFRKQALECVVVVSLIPRTNNTAAQQVGEMASDPIIAASKNQIEVFTNWYVVTLQNSNSTDESGSLAVIFNTFKTVTISQTQ